MSVKRSLITLTIALAGQLATGVAYGWGVGGSIVSDFKQGDQDLYCALAAPNSSVIVDAIENPKYFSLGGTEIRCWEVDHGKSDGPNGDFRFKLIQISMVGGPQVYVCGEGAKVCEDGIKPPDDHIVKRITWSFRVEPSSNQDLLWRLIPTNAAARAQFCLGIPDPQQCGVNFGLDEHDGAGERKADYPKVTIKGAGRPTVELFLGEIFRFTTELYDDGHVEAKLGWRACHSGQFDLNLPVKCGFGSAKPTAARGAGRGKP